VMYSLSWLSREYAVDYAIALYLFRAQTFVLFLYKVQTSMQDSANQISIATNIGTKTKGHETNKFSQLSNN